VQALARSRKRAGAPAVGLACIVPQRESAVTNIEGELSLSSTSSEDSSRYIFRTLYSSVYGASDGSKVFVANDGKCMLERSRSLPAFDMSPAGFNSWKSAVLRSQKQTDVRSWLAVGVESVFRSLGRPLNDIEPLIARHVPVSALHVRHLRSIWLAVAEKAFGLNVRGENDTTDEIQLGDLTNEDIFFGKYTQEPDPHCLSSGKGRMGLIERVYHLNALRLRLLYGDDLKRDRNAAMLTFEVYAGKRIADLEMPPGARVPHPNGVYVVEKHVSNGGAFALCLTPLHDKDSRGEDALALEPHLPLVVVFRGTRPYPSSSESLNSILNDMEERMGHTGISFVAPQLLHWIHSHSPQRQVHLIGMSLGGVHVQRFLPTLCPTAVYRATTVCSPGVDLETAAYWQCLVDQTPLAQPLDINVVRNAQDCTPTVGGTCHIGKGVPASKALIKVHYLDDDSTSGPHRIYCEPRNHIAAILYLFRDLDREHVRLIVDKPFRDYIIE